MDYTLNVKTKGIFAYDPRGTKNLWDMCEGPTRSGKKEIIPDQVLKDNRKYDKVDSWLQPIEWVLVIQ